MSSNIEVYEEHWDLDDLEKDFISIILSNNKKARKLFVDFYKDIRPNYFKNKVFGNVFKAISLFFDKEKDFPSENRILSILQKTGASQEDIDTIKKAYQDSLKEFRISEIDSLHSDIELFIRQNKAKTAILKAASFLQKKDFSEKIMQDVKDALLWNPQIDLGFEITEVEKRYRKIEELFTEFIPTPWKWVNENIGGGFYKKQLTLFTSASSVGKSIALDQLALNAWMGGKNVVMITLELSDAVKSMRMDSCLLEKEVKTLIANYKEVEKVYKTYSNHKSKLFIKEFPTSSCSVQDIENYLYQLELYENIKLEEIDLICVDYADIMLPVGGSSGDSYKDGRLVCENLRGLAQRLNVCVASAVQLNRKTLTVGIEELSEEHLADSWWKMNSSDIIIALWNNPELRENERIYFKMLKNRMGKKSIYAELNAYYEFLKFVD